MGRIRLHFQRHRSSNVSVHRCSDRTIVQPLLLSLSSNFLLQIINSDLLAGVLHILSVPNKCKVHQKYYSSFCLIFGSFFICYIIVWKSFLLINFYLTFVDTIYQRAIIFYFSSFFTPLSGIRFGLQLFTSKKDQNLELINSCINF